MWVHYVKSRLKNLSNNISFLDVHFLCALEGGVGKRNNIASIWFISVKTEKFIRFYRPYVTAFRFNLTVYHTLYAEHLFLLFLFLTYLLLYLLFYTFIYTSIPAIAGLCSFLILFSYIIYIIIILFRNHQSKKCYSIKWAEHSKYNKTEWKCLQLN